MVPMRKAAGVALIVMGAIEFAIYGIVMLRLPFGLALGHRDVGVYVDPVITPLCASAFLAAGVFLVRQSKPARASRP
jgi:hypothetical protein